MTSTEASGSSSSIIFRLGLAVAGGLFIYLAAVLANSVTPATAALNVPVLIVLGALGLFALVSAGVHRPASCLRWLILAAYLMQMLVQAQVWLQFSRLPILVATDVGLNTELSATLVRHGQNPYAWDLNGVYDLYRTEQKYTTPLLNGASVGQYSYAGLLFLLLVPFQALGLPAVFTLSILGHVATLVLAFLATPRRWQPVILIPALAGFDFSSLTTTGNLDILWVLALVGMAAAWRRPTLRALMFGLAVSLKQSPALLAPFLLIRLWKEDEPGGAFGRVSRFTLITAATFLITNGPFLLWNPSAWIAGYTDPVREALVVLSHGGLSTLIQGGILDLPKSYFLLVTLVVFGLLIFVYWRYVDVLRDVFWLFPGIILWVSYRSLAGYWLYWAFPMLLVVVRPSPPMDSSRPSPSWKPTLAVALGSVAALVAVGFAVALPKAPVEVSLRLPISVGQDPLERLTVDVRNLGSHTLTPRFAIQSRSTLANPLPWDIEDGPRVLLAGESATYTIASNRPDRVFYRTEPVQLLVTDAGGDYSLRGLLTIEADTAYLWPEMILNADFRIWNEGEGMPGYWLPSNVDTAALVTQDGRQGIQLTAGPSLKSPREVRLSTNFLYPGVPFGIWLYPPAAGNSSAYGLDISDGQQRLWIVFGPQPYAGPVEKGVHVIQRTVPAGEWTYQQIDLKAAYAEAGLSPPTLGRAYYRGLDIDARVMDLGLFFTNYGSSPGAALFGPIIQSSHPEAPQALMEDTLRDPAAYYRRLGQEYERQRNTALALQAYQVAVLYAPQDAGMLMTIEGLKRELAGEPR